MMIDIEEVISLMKEELHKKQEVALTIHESVNTQYSCLGKAQGVKELIKKFEQLQRRESY